MSFFKLLFQTGQPSQRRINRADFIVILCLGMFLYAGLRLGTAAPEIVRGPSISLAPSILPYYAALSLGRMFAAYVLSLLFALIYGRMAAYNRRAERLLMPLLDVLQSVPILSFLPVVLLSLSALMPETWAAELASVILIFTSQAWNITYAWYQSLTTLPKELREASTIFRLNSWLRFKTLELPFAGVSLIWNSVMSWAGGWFFLMAAEIFTVGNRDFRLPGLGAYLQEAANQGDLRATLYGLATLIVLIIALDQFVWRPLLAWSERFKLAMVENDHPPTSWFYDALRGAALIDWISNRLLHPASEAIDHYFKTGKVPPVQPADSPPESPVGYYVFLSFGLLALAWGAYLVAGQLLALSLVEWVTIGLGLLATFGRVLLAILLTLAWTVPVGVAIGTNPRLANILQPVAQVAASVPATAFLPAILLLLIRLPWGLNLAALLLMLLGAQWYLLFNVIAGAASIPQDLKYTTRMLNIQGWERWRTLILPALFPYVVTGAITAAGGAWNASIVAEHVSFSGQVYNVTGIGAVIAKATISGNYDLLLAATLSLILVVVLINRLFWRRLYQLAENQYRLE